MPEKKRQKALELKNEALENYFANTIIPQLYVDRDLILRKFTPPAMRQFSLSDKDIDKHIEDVKDNIRYPDFIENIKEVMGNHKILEKEVQTTDGRWFQMNILPYVDFRENKSDGVIITFVDLTRRISTLREMEQINTEYETLLYTLAHDIRQPLSVISLVVHQLKKEYNPSKPQELLKRLDTLEETTNSINSLVSAFTEDAHNKSNSLETRVSIEDVYRDVTAILRDEISNNNINITTQFSATDILMPKNKLRSIIYNLIYNAIKFRRKEVSLEIRLTTEQLDDYVELIIKDNGMGISEEEQDNIFKKSARLNHNIDGTGMGLYIIKRILENRGGKIDVESTPGKGTSFKLCFKSS